VRDGKAPTYVGTTKRLPEFNLVDKVVLVSGAARGLGLVQAEALLEAGAIGISSLFVQIFFHSTACLGRGIWQLMLDSLCTRPSGNALP
jgi:hypothetical protein